MMDRKINVTVWNEFQHEKSNEVCKALYPDGMHAAIGAGLLEEGSFEVKYATLDMEDHGLTEEVLSSTDVLIWWGHCAHDKVRDEIVDRVQKHIQEGMGLIVLHSGHMSKIFRRMLGTSCTLKWREIGEKERVWTVEPTHPIAAGLENEYFELPHTEMYGERFDIPTPKDVVFITWYAGGEVFRSGVTFERGYGKIFYFAPGHETFPIYYDKNVRRVICNAAKWAKPVIRKALGCPKVDPIEKIEVK